MTRKFQLRRTFHIVHNPPELKSHPWEVVDNNMFSISEFRTQEEAFAYAGELSKRETRRENADFMYEALKQIALKRHTDRSCSLEAQGFTEIECAVIGAEDALAQIALEAISFELPEKK